MARGLLTAAIDFGTSFSTWAFSFKHDYDCDKIRIQFAHWPCFGNRVSEKAPTHLLIRPDNTAVFGYDAMKEFAYLAEESKHTDCKLFKNFKMQLFDKKINRKLMITDDVSGEKVPALKVFAEAIKCLKNSLMEKANSSIASSDGKTEASLKDKDYYWVLTVPAIWDDAAKQFMREAANEAGISNNQLSVALEPEAASVYCRHLPTVDNNRSMSSLLPGHKYLILDAGGGTVDITVHEVCDDGKLKEVHNASGGDWGGRRVDKEFEKLLSDLFGHDAIEKFKKREIEDYMYLMDCFETGKRITKDQIDRMVTIHLPPTLAEYLEQGQTFATAIENSTNKDKLRLGNGKLRMDYVLFKSLFDISVNNTISKVAEILAHEDVTGCNTILMVGGFSGSVILQNAVREKFPEVSVVVPLDPELTIVKGAVIYGHDPSIITHRKLKYTYGTNVIHENEGTCTHAPARIENVLGKPHCMDIFSAHVRVGDTVKLYEETDGETYSPVHPLAGKTIVRIYRSTKKNPELVTDESCSLVGTLELKITPTLVAFVLGMSIRDIGFKVSFMFGDTEIKVKGYDNLLGTSMEIKLNCLDHESEVGAASK